MTTFDVAGEVAEILAVTPNGRTLLYTDSAAKELGIVDLTAPAAPEQVGTVSVGGEPTSVTVTRDGRYALVTVDTSTSFTAPPAHWSWSTCAGWRWRTRSCAEPRPNSPPAASQNE